MFMRLRNIGGRRRTLAMLCSVLTVLALCIAAIGFVIGSPNNSWPTPARRAVHARLEKAAVPQPIAEPSTVVALSPDQARASNSAVPIVLGGAKAALPFIYRGSQQDRASAQTCLAAAIYYEAGDDAAGEQAVAQVIINRLRNPAFPKSICGVVFQGSERKTGCQFTFSCDGSLSRSPPPSAWTRAREIAGSALSGVVARSVGLATYYHADWVVPYWRDSLDKVAILKGHIFYRWKGKWGRIAAYDGRVTSPEMLDPKIAALAGVAAVVTFSLDDGIAAPALTSLSIAGVPHAALKGAIVRLKDDDAGQYVLQLAPTAAPGTFAITAFTICAEKADCLVMAWADEQDVPRTLPILPLVMRSMVFMYRKSSVLGDARPFWDCKRYPRSVKGQCLPGTGSS